MCEKYPLSLLETPNLTQAAQDAVNWFHNFKYDCPASVLGSYPSIMTCCILKDQMDTDQSVCKRLICVLLAALRTNGEKNKLQVFRTNKQLSFSSPGSCGVHVCINRSDAYMQQFYGKLGFTEVHTDHVKMILGRNF
jgi:protein O-GlcNAcase/histone acetyltransferase